MRLKDLTIGSLVLTVTSVMAVAAVLALSVSFFLDGREGLSRRRTALQLATSRMGEIIRLDSPSPGSDAESSIISGGDEYDIRTRVTLLPDSGREVRIEVTTPQGERVSLARRLYTGIGYGYRMDNESV